MRFPFSPHISVHTIRLHKQRIWYGFRDIVRKCLPIWCLFFAFFCAMTVIGIVAAIRLGEDYVRPNPYYQIQFDEYSAFPNFLKQSCLSALVFACGFCGTFRKGLVCVVIACLSYLGYRFGLNCVGACNVHLASGICSISLFYLPICLTLLIGCTAITCMQVPLWLRCNVCQTCPTLIRRSALRSLCAWGCSVGVLFCITVITPTLTRWFLFG